MYKKQILVAFFVLFGGYHLQASRFYTAVEDFENRQFSDATTKFINCARNGNPRAFFYLDHIHKHRDLLGEFKLSEQDEGFLSKVPQFLPYIPSQLPEGPNWLQSSLLWLELPSRDNFKNGTNDPAVTRVIKGLRVYIDDKAISKHNSHAHYLLGLLHEQGVYLPQNYAEALKHYLQSAHRADFQGLLGWERMEKHVAEKNKKSILKKLDVPYANLYSKELKFLSAMMLGNKEAKDGDAQFDLALQYKGGGSSNIKKNLFRKADWQAAALSLGEIEAQKIYTDYYGKLPNKDPTEEWKWRHMLAYQGIPLLQLELSFWLRIGRDDLQPSVALSVYYFEQLENNIAALGDLSKNSQIREQLGEVYRFMGGIYERGKEEFAQDYKRAVEYYKKGFELKDSIATYNLGVMYEQGQGGLLKDQVEALRLYKIAAQANHADAIYNVGRYHENGWGGLKSDETTALLEYRKAAKYDHADAIFHISQFYLQGRGGVNVDEKLALAFAEKAATKGSTDAAYFLALHYFNNVDTYVQNATKIISWLEQAAKDPHSRARFDLGLAYLNGYNGVPHDQVKAREYFEKVPQDNDSYPDALANLGLIYMDGLGGVARNSEKARQLLNAAVQRNSQLGAYNLAQLLWRDPQPDYQAIVLNLNIAATAEDADAFYLLGILHHQGLACEANVTMAMEYYKKAAAKGHMLAGYNAGILSLFNPDKKIAKEDLLDRKEAMKYIAQAAHAGIPVANFVFGLLRYQEGDAEGIKAGRKHFEYASQNGIGRATEVLDVLNNEGYLSRDHMKVQAKGALIQIMLDKPEEKEVNDELEKYTKTLLEKDPRARALRRAERMDRFLDKTTSLNTKDFFQIIAQQDNYEIKSSKGSRVHYHGGEAKSSLHLPHDRDRAAKRSQKDMLETVRKLAKPVDPNNNNVSWLDDYEWKQASSEKEVQAENIQAEEDESKSNSDDDKPWWE